MKKKLSQIQILDNECGNIKFSQDHFCFLFVESLGKKIELDKTQKLIITQKKNLEKTTFNKGHKLFNFISSVSIKFDNSDFDNLSVEKQIIRTCKIIKTAFDELDKIEPIDLEVIYEALDKLEQNNYIFCYYSSSKNSRRKVIGQTVKYIDLKLNKISLFHLFKKNELEIKKVLIFEANLKDIYSIYLFSNSKWVSSHEYVTLNKTKEIFFTSNLENNTDTIDFKPTKNELAKLKNELFLTGYGNRKIGTFQEEQKLELSRIDIF